MNGQPVQKHLAIKEIKNDLLILKDNSLRAVLMVSSTNFALKSTAEQEAIVYRYQNFLNSLDFPIQILIITRKINIDPYIQKLSQGQKKLESELLQIQLTQYIDFVKSLTEVTNIMNQFFYLTISFTPPIIKKVGFFKKVFGFSKEKEKEATLNEEMLKEYKTQLWQRIEFVNSGLWELGLRSVPLKTNELIELFYQLYNPST